MISILMLLLPDLLWSLIFGLPCAGISLYATHLHRGVAPIPFWTLSIVISLSSASILSNTDGFLSWLLLALLGYAISIIPGTFRSDFADVVGCMWCDVKNWYTVNAQIIEKQQILINALQKQVANLLPYLKKNVDLERRNEKLDALLVEARLKIRHQEESQLYVNIAANSVPAETLKQITREKHRLQDKVLLAKKEARSALEDIDSARQEGRDWQSRYNNERAQNFLSSRKAQQLDTIAEMLNQFAESGDVDLRKASILVAKALSDHLDLYAMDIDKRKVENLFVWVQMGDACPIRPQGGFRLEDKVYPLTGLQVVGTTAINTRQQAPAPVLVAAPVAAPVLAPVGQPASVSGAGAVIQGNAPVVSVLPPVSVPPVTTLFVAAPAAPATSAFGAGATIQSNTPAAPAPLAASLAASAPVNEAGMATGSKPGAGMTRFANRNNAGRSVAGRRKR